MKLALALTLIALTGCETMQRYPKTTAFVATSIALSAYGMSRDDRQAEPKMSIPLTPDCAKYPELCR